VVYKQIFQILEDSVRLIVINFNAIFDRIEGMYRHTYIFCCCREMKLSMTASNMNLNKETEITASLLVL